MELEEIMEKLEETVMTMEHEKLSLEEAYATFSRGMKLVVEGNKAIDQYRYMEICTAKKHTCHTSKVKSADRLQYG